MPDKAQQIRDEYTGRYAYKLDDFDRMCTCGHTLGIHVAGGFDCLNSDRWNIHTPDEPEYHAADNKPCACVKFRQSRRKR